MNDETTDKEENQWHSMVSVTCEKCSHHMTVSTQNLTMELLLSRFNKLAKYAAHKGWCDTSFTYATGPKLCNCGLSDVLPDDAE